jgi:hypothetical protein
MDSIQISNRTLQGLAWGAFFVWWGLTELVRSLPEGTGLAGFGLILLGLNAARALNGLPVSPFTVTLGILGLVWGGLELAGFLLSLPFELPVFAILLIALGAIVLVRELTANNSGK